jgi:hypothetical protein
MIERGHGAGLAGETFGELGFGDFDGDGAVPEPTSAQRSQMQVKARIAGLPDFAHAAGADGLGEAVGTKKVARGERHICQTSLSRSARN